MDSVLKTAVFVIRCIYTCTYNCIIVACKIDIRLSIIPAWCVGGGGGGWAGIAVSFRLV